MTEFSRKDFLGFGGAAALLAAAGCRSAGVTSGRDAKIQGFDEMTAVDDLAAPWVPFSEKKVRVGIAGQGFCWFGGLFNYQDHPNVEVVACAELDPKRRENLQQTVRAPKAYASCEEMIKHAAEDKLEAVYVATDARSHVQLAIMALEHGLHVVTSCPVFLGKDQLEYVPKLLDAVKRSGKLYMMNETTAFRPECYAMRKLYEDGKFGAITYCEGEYFHPGGNDPDEAKGKPHDHFSYKAWRWGLPPMYYPTHSNGFYTCVTHKRFTEVTCTGVPSLKFPYTKAGQNEYGNPYGSEYAMYKCEDGASARMLVAWDQPAWGAEIGRIWGQKGCCIPEHCYGPDGKRVLARAYRGWFEKEFNADIDRYLKPQLAPNTSKTDDYGGHGGSHAYLTDDFIRGIILPDHKVCVDVVMALNTTIAGVYAHLSAMKGGEALKIPEISL